VRGRQVQVAGVADDDGVEAARRAASEPRLRKRQPRQRAGAD
jgi:hypothetical protein